MTLRRAGAVLLLCTAVTAACSSGNAADRSPSTPSSTATAATAPPTSPQLRRFAAQLRRGVLAVRTAHFRLTTRTGSQTLHGAGDESLTDAVPQRIHLSEDVTGGGTLELVVIGDHTYARLPARVYRTTKPWLLISKDSAVAAVRQLATSIEAARSTASLDLINQFAAAATNLRRGRPHAVDGVRTTPYTLTVATARLPDTMSAKSALQTLGLSSIPVEIDLDTAGRPVRVAETVHTGGQVIATEIVLSRLNQPVAISAPPADQVGAA